MAIQNASQRTPRHRRLPRVGAGDGGRPGHAPVARRRRQPGRQAQREPRPRVHGAVHPRRGQLHRGGRAVGRAGAHRLDGQRGELAARRSSPSATTRGPRRCSARRSTDTASLVDGLVGMPVSPQFLATRVWTRFVSDTPPDPATLGTLVRAYGSGHDITALMRAAARAPAFRDPGSVHRPRAGAVADGRVAGAERACDEGARRTARGGADRPRAGAVRAAERRSAGPRAPPGSPPRRRWRGSTWPGRW